MYAYGDSLIPRGVPTSIVVESNVYICCPLFEYVVINKEEMGSIASFFSVFTDDHKHNQSHSNTYFKIDSVCQTLGHWLFTWSFGTAHAARIFDNDRLCQRPVQILSSCTSCPFPEFLFDTAQATRRAAVTVIDRRQFANRCD